MFAAAELRKVNVDISIVICTRSRVASLKETLASLAKVAIKGLIVEAIVVDNASTDDTGAVVKNLVREFPFRLRLLNEPRPGKCKAYNLAFRESTGRVIVSTDDDMRFSRDWLVNLTAPVLEGRFDAVAGWVEMAPHLRRDWMTPELYNFYACSYPQNAQTYTGIAGANMAFSRRALEAVGPFDEKLGVGTEIGSGEETLFERKLSHAGFRAGSAYEARVEHHFLEDRLRMTAIQRAAAAYGRGVAYIAYHWDGMTFVAPRLRAAIKRRQAAKIERERVVLGIDPEAFDERLFRLWRGIGRLEQYANESKGPRKYQPTSGGYR